jgi:hypothetical protein
VKARGKQFGRIAVRAGLICVLACSLVQWGLTQNASNERIFPQSKAQVEKTLRAMQSSTAGRLPSLDGFARPGEHPLDSYERGYFQAEVEVASTPSGGTRVRVNVKVTAWYKDPIPSHSGYQLLASNGRIESDLLDQLSEQLASVPAAKEARGANREIAANGTEPAATEVSRPEPAASRPAPSPTGASQPAAPLEPAVDQPEISAPAPKLLENDKTFTSSLSQGLASQGTAPNKPTASDADDATLRQEAENLEELLKNQAHPTNLVAVKKSGTPVVDSPSLNAKPLFMASAHDEFEMLDYTADWVHVRISGIARGWIWRDGLEMPDGVPDTDSSAASPVNAAQDLFSVEREETGQFPGDWNPLRGKDVEIFSIQDSGNKTKQAGSRDRLEYAKYIFEKNYQRLAGKSPALAGIVVIFDSVDGGMVAATSATLRDWRAGTLSDSAMWHQCFFDPPETFDTAGNSGSK